MSEEEERRRRGGRVFSFATPPSRRLPTASPSPRHSRTSCSAFTAAWQAGTEKVPERKLGEGRLRSRLGVQEDRNMDVRDKDKEELWIIRKAKGNLAIDEEEVVEVDDGEEDGIEEGEACVSCGEGEQAEERMGMTATISALATYKRAVKLL